MCPIPYEGELARVCAESKALKVNAGYPHEKTYATDRGDTDLPKPSLALQSQRHRIVKCSTR